VDSGSAVRGIRLCWSRRSRCSMYGRQGDAGRGPGLLLPGLLWLLKPGDEPRRDSSATPARGRLVCVRPGIRGPRSCTLRGSPGRRGLAVHHRGPVRRASPPAHAHLFHRLPALSTSVLPAQARWRRTSLRARSRLGAADPHGNPPSLPAVRVGTLGRCRRLRAGFPLAVPGPHDPLTGVY
jgi:hypothetical protein